MRDQHHAIQRRMIDVINRQLMGKLGGTHILNGLPIEHLHAVRRFILSFPLLDDDHAIDWMDPDNQPAPSAEPKPVWEPTGKVDEAPAVATGEWRDAPHAPEDFQRGFQAWAAIVDSKLHALETRIGELSDRIAGGERRLTGVFRLLNHRIDMLTKLPELSVTGAGQPSVGMADGTRLAMLEDTLFNLSNAFDAVVDMLGEGSRAPGALSYAARIGQLADQARKLTELAKHPTFGWKTETDAGTLITARPGDKVLLMAHTRTMGGAVLKEQWAKVLHVDTENGRYQIELANALGTETRSIPWVDFRYIKDVSPAVDVRFPQEKLD